MADEDRERWNAKYRRGGHARAEPSVALTSMQSWLPRAGRALDVAGGAGSNARWLAERGLEVTVVDVSDVALATAADEARRVGVELGAIRADLECEPLPAGPWDLVLCSHYVQRDLIPAIAQGLAPGGRFVWIHPTTKNLERHARPSRRFLLEPGEAPALVEDAGLRVLWSEEAWLGEGPEARFLSRVVAVRPPGRRAAGAS